MIEFDSLEEFRDPETYDLEVAGNDEELPLIEQWARSLEGPLLDLACGTGRTAIPLAAQGYQVTGVDIVPEMLAYAQQKAAAQSVSVEWLQADARAFHLQQQFAFMYMVGNAFQFFLTRADQEALLARVREHLTPDGGFLFETRNPSRQNLYETHHPDPREYAAADGRRLVVTEDQQYDPMTQIQTYTSYYQWLHPDDHQDHNTKRVALRYVFPQEIEALLHYNGFQIRAHYGSWQQAPLTATSREMIYVCQRRM